MLTVDSFCRRVFAPRPTDMILYYLFIILSHPPPPAPHQPKKKTKYNIQKHNEKKPKFH